MARVLGVNVFAVLAAAVAHYFLSFLVYGLVFTGFWLSQLGYTVEQAEAVFAPHQWKMPLGVIMPILLSIGLAGLFRKVQPLSLAQALGWAGFAWLTLGFPPILYFFVYQMYPLGLVVLDGAHALVSFALVAVILFLWR